VRFPAGDRLELDKLVSKT
jgi:antitoxin component of MazEF toxin-antitoxin module